LEVLLATIVISMNAISSLVLTRILVTITAPNRFLY
jgi:hypothetical protein